MKKIEKTIDFGGRKLTLKTGDFAFQATGAVIASYGETVVLATVVASDLKEDLGYFPLTVEYRERLSAGGKIKGSRWVKREGRPTDDEILTARLIDRSIRPLFPETYKKEVQVICQVLSVDMETGPNIIAGIAATAAIEASEIPWKGPVSMVRVGLVDGKNVLNPVEKDVEKSQLDLVVSSTKDAIVMIEAGANEIPEKDIETGIGFAQKESMKLLKFIEDFAKEVGIKKEAVEKQTKDASLEKKVKELSGDKIKDLIKKISTKEASYSDLDAVKDAIKESLGEEKADEAGVLFDEIFKKQVRSMILKGKRPDGRNSDEIRKLDAKVGVLPRVHGSAIFLRGQTQALTVATLGAPSLEQLIETAEGEETKRYIHHYAMPPYSIGETGRYGFPSRREIGHGALGERALVPVLPSSEDFPYTIHVLTEILSSNGSTSMAATCGSTLSLMDAGVPIKAPVAGIAMGLVIENEKNVVVLTDITGLEDGNGDMDFKVAGTKEGVTALQLDVKTLSLTLPILKKALVQAKDARLEILDVMKKCISKPKSKVSKYAPKIKSVTIPQDKIGELIGPGGKTIKKLMLDTGTQVDVDDDGVVSICGEDQEKVQKAVDFVESLTKEVVPGEIYKGEVKRIENYGAFVEILPGKEGLVHVSSMAEDFVKDPNDVVSLGQEVEVRVKKIDEMGRIDLSMILDPKKERNNGNGDRGRSQRNEGQRRFPRGGRRDTRGRNMDRRPSQNRSSGPHFPTSRLMSEDKKR